MRVADKEAALSHPAVQEAYRQAGQALKGQGRALLRKSGTEPVVRVMVEAAEESICQKYVDQIVEAMRNEKLVVEE